VTINSGEDSRSGGSLNYRLHNGGYLLYNGQPNVKGVYPLVTKEGAQYFAIYGNDKDGDAGLKSALSNPDLPADITVEDFLKRWTGEMNCPYVIILDKPINIKSKFPVYGASMVQMASIKFQVPEEWDGKYATITGQLFIPENNHHHTKILLQVINEGDVRITE
jgi:hypothetical protein